ncbi:hypothetical protein Nepgr_025012 [Nepenthes gracilis]|uniref:LysM domain-containing protein n=1 Tax=Nepenthes gracilis TaxID=150966 RepID=A0AAD3T5H2_NEPGR|nr:hypothetical protein Nepgr_025012 [Nepenthes gracilis]
MNKARNVMPKQGLPSWLAAAEKVSWFCALLMAFMVVMSLCQEEKESDYFVKQRLWTESMKMKEACDEIYVVREGETLQTISEKCGDPFIVEENPHIHDPDDVFPGLIIKITPFKNRDVIKVNNLF